MEALNPTGERKRDVGRNCKRVETPVTSKTERSPLNRKKCITEYNERPPKYTKQTRELRRYLRTLTMIQKTVKTEGTSSQTKR